MGHGEVRDEKPILDSVLALISVYQKDLAGLVHFGAEAFTCLLYTSDAADEHRDV